MTVEGLDLSHWDGLSEYTLDGKGFVVIKTTEGTGYVDPAAAGHFAKARAAGVLIGAYHFARDDAPLYGQGQYFLDNTPDDATFLAIDNEGKHVLNQAQCTTLISYVKSRDPLKRPVLLYMSDSTFFPAGQDYNWVAKWGGTPPTRQHLLWQYQSGSANASGEDQDRYDGTINQLTAILGAKGGAEDMSYPVPRVPSDVLVGINKTLYTTSALSATDPGRIVVTPARRMPYFGGPAGVGIVEYVDAQGAHSGKSYFAHAADLSDLRAIPVPDDGYTAATQAAAVAAQKAADQAALDAAAALATKAQAALDAAQSSLAASVAAATVNATTAEQARIKGVLGLK